MIFSRKKGLKDDGISKNVNDEGKSGESIFIKNFHKMKKPTTKLGKVFWVMYGISSYICAILGVLLGIFLRLVFIIPIGIFYILLGHTLATCHYDRSGW